MKYRATAVILAGISVTGIARSLISLFNGQLYAAAGPAVLAAGFGYGAFEMARGNIAAAGRGLLLGALGFGITGIEELVNTPGEHDTEAVLNIGIGCFSVLGGLRPKYLAATMRQQSSSI
ncbi:MAG: hypothetical protein HYT16_03485 [DPANN group archaeon]|nr:hypothetical protein [DPANN group archaeon]